VVTIASVPFLPCPVSSVNLPGSTSVLSSALLPHAAASASVVPYFADSHQFHNVFSEAA